MLVVACNTTLRMLCSSNCSVQNVCKRNEAPQFKNKMLFWRYEATTLNLFPLKVRVSNNKKHVGGLNECFVCECEA